MPDIVADVASFIAWFATALGFTGAFCAIYVRLTPHQEFDLIVRQHNASAAIALGGSLVGFAVALAGAIHNTQTPLEFMAWGAVAMITQFVAYFFARMSHRDLSNAIEQNAIAAAIWLASISIATGIISAACMSP